MWHFQHFDAIDRNDDFFYYYLQRGLVRQKLNEPAAAQRDLERSVELLPTANAYNALGNIARGRRQYAAAKDYYAKAAGNESAAGEAAFGSLVELDLADNPGKYLRVRTGMNRSGGVVAEISNPTPRDVTGLVVAVQYPDATGRLRQAEKSLAGRLKAGEKTVVGLEVVVNARQAQQIRGAIVAARVAQ